MAKSPIERPALLRLFEGREAVIFDLDGTLHGGGRDVESAGDSARVTGMRLRHRMGTADCFESFSLFDRFVKARVPEMSKSEALLACFGIGLSEMNRFRETHESPEQFVRPAPDVARAIYEIRQRFRLILATNNSRSLALRIVKCLGLNLSLFEYVQASEDVGFPKPDPRFFTQIMNVVGLPAARLVSVGDGQVTDVAPALALGMGAWQVRGPQDIVQLAGILGGASS